MSDAEVEAYVMRFCELEGISPHKNAKTHIDGIGLVNVFEWQRRAIEELPYIKCWMKNHHGIPYNGQKKA